MGKKLAIAGAIGLGTIAGAGIARWLWQRSRYLKFHTMFGRARVYEVADDDGSPVRLLEVDGIVQSGTYVDEERYPELVFEYLKRYDLMFEAERPIEHVCVLGCGGYDYPEHLIAHHAPVVVDAVEIDPAITAIAERYFFLDRLREEYNTDKTGRLNLKCCDAQDYLLTTTTTYDAIVNDAFDGGKPPEHLVGRSFAEAVHERLVDDGIYLTNIVSALEGEQSELLREQVALLESVFAHVYVFPCSPETLDMQDNVIVAATDQPLPEHVAISAVALPHLPY